MDEQSPNKRYLVRKDGLYFRPGARGYTSQVLHAGLFEEDRAKQLSVDGEIFAVPLEHVRDQINHEIASLETTMATVRAQIKYLDELRTQATPPPASETPYSQALALLHAGENVSCAQLQRRLKVGFNAAAEIIEEMHRQGLIAQPDLRAENLFKIPSA